ncbi:MAG: insulinase family protein, partial [Chitinophagaceae bacterium]
PPPVFLVEPAQDGERRLEVRKDVATPYIFIGHHVPNAKSEDYYALRLLSDILSSGKSSRLYSSLIDRQQLATTVFSSYDESFDPTLFGIAGVTNKGVDVAALETAIYAEIEKIKTEGVNARELEKVKNGKLIDFYGQVETINGKSNNLGTYEVFFGDYKKMFEAPTRYNQVTADDIKRVANTYFRKNNRTVGILKSKVD